MQPFMQTRGAQQLTYVAYLKHLLIMACEEYKITAGSVIAIPGIRFAIEVSGPVKALPRPLFMCRTVNGVEKKWIVNKAMNHQRKLRQVIEQSLPEDVKGRVIFLPGTPLMLKAKFFHGRHMNHFVGRERDVSMIKDEYKNGKQSFMVKKPNVDNCVKFIMDYPLEGLVYNNDSAVISIVAEKSWDNVGECLGRTVIEIVPAYIELG
jgi:Holliday junction resolvase RusA-like endonuclease